MRAPSLDESDWRFVRGVLVWADATLGSYSDDYRRITNEVIAKIDAPYEELQAKVKAIINPPSDGKSET